MYLQKPALELKYERQLKTLADKISFIGPQSLYDKNFVPPKFVVRERPSKLLSGIVLDSLSDNYPTNLLLYGLKGTGKNLMANRKTSAYRV